MLYYRSCELFRLMSMMLFSNCYLLVNLKETVSRKLSRIDYLSIHFSISFPFFSLFQIERLPFLALVLAIFHDFIKTRAILSWKRRRYQINCSASTRRRDLFGSFPLPHVSTSKGDFCHRNPFVGIIMGI